MKRLNYFENIKLSFRLIISIDKGISRNKKVKNNLHFPTKKSVCEFILSRLT